MKIQCCGTSGSVSTNHDTITVLINDQWCIDAGSICRYLSVEEQSTVKGIFLTHAHLDHIQSLCFFADNILFLRQTPVEVFATKTVIDHLKKHVFNNIIWPDFSRIPNRGNTPTLTFVEINGNIERDGLQFQPIAVNHGPGSVGYSVTDKSGSWIFAGDSGPTEDIWNHARSLGSSLQGIVIDVSFPNRFKDIAEKSLHLCPEMLARELGKIPPGIPIYINHLKPLFRDETIREIAALGNKYIHILEDGELISETQIAA